MENPHFLERIFNSDRFSVAEQESIITCFRQVSFERNGFLLHEGKTAQQYWFMQTGFARAFVTDAAGRDITTQFYTPGDIVMDWSSFFLRQPALENIQALTPCVCWQLDFDTFQTLFHSIKTFREFGRSNFAAGYFALKRQHIAMVADQAKERYQQLLREKPQLVQNVSLKHIATYLGITDTSLSRIRKEIASV